MVKHTVIIGGIVLGLIGWSGFCDSRLLGMLGFTLNLLHLTSGGAALYFGLRAEENPPRTFCIVLGGFYSLLGLAGFSADGSHNLLTIIPGTLILGTMDHLLHLGLGIWFLLVGLVQKIGVTFFPDETQRQSASTTYIEYIHEN